MKNFQNKSLIAGWGVFFIALVTYMLTLEPTASLWDCAEFIATSYKLEVGHPPGTPLFFLINRFAAMFAGDTANVAYAINTMSAIESALTIAFMFWTIVMLVNMMNRRVSAVLSSEQQWSAIAAGVVGSLAYAFSDTFWFSAVEAEVYALSSLFTAVVFWAILKWETVADNPNSNKWIILIAYLMGLSIGAHILNLLAIPALVFVYYFKKFPGKPTKELWKPLAVGIVLTGVFYQLTPTVISIGAMIDRLFVNSFSLPVNLGLVTTVVVFFLALCWGVWWSHKKTKVLLNTILISAVMIFIGFSSYGIVLIRSTVNPPMNSNHPADPYSLKSFINREQYGSAPLLKGPTYASPVVDYSTNVGYVLGDNGKYEQVESIDRVFDPATTMIFPRVYEGQGPNAARYIQEYKTWGDVKGKQVRAQSGEMVTVPTFGENMRYFFTYQLNHMYVRYFLWNFVGRQSDIQSTGNIDNGQWMSGIKPIDEIYLGPQDNLPDEIAANRGRNSYFFLPFILGLVGLFFHLKKDGRGFFVVTMLFFMTGAAVILYLNQTPLQPRERDYAYAASFYAFAIWIGIGLIPVFSFLGKYIKQQRVALGIATVICLSVPTILAQQNWDDHDRSGRTVSRDMGLNYLNSTLPNAILINYGDNDAFPVWYAQEVEGVRTDVRPMNYSYITGKWYIDQMRVKANESEPVPFTIPKHKYADASSRQFVIQETPHPAGREWTAKEVMAVVNSDEPSTKVYTQGGRAYDFVPTRRIAVPVNKANAIEAGILTKENAHLAEDTIYVEFDDKKQDLYIDEMLFIDLLANFDWKRPLYFTSYGDLLKFGLVNTKAEHPYSYLQADGIAYLLTPIKSPVDNYYNIGRVDTKRLYDNLMNKFSYGNLKDSTVYADTFVHNTFSSTRLRAVFAQLAGALMAEGDTVRALEVLDRAMVEMPVNQLRFDDDLIPIITAYWEAGSPKGDAIAEAYARNEAQYVDYYKRFKGRKGELVDNVSFNHLRNLYMLVIAAQDFGNFDLVDKYKSYLAIEQPTAPKPAPAQAPASDSSAK